MSRTFIFGCIVVVAWLAQHFVYYSMYGNLLGACSQSCSVRSDP